MDTTGPLTQTLTPEVCMQKAADILFSPFPSPEEVQHAQALTSMGRELRIGKKNRHRGYSDVNYVVTPELPTDEDRLPEDGPEPAPVATDVAEPVEATEAPPVEEPARPSGW